MKTKELIARLQAADPTGETHCCIGNADIWDVNVEPAFYDGALQVLEFDEDNRPIRGTRVEQGSKLNLQSISISEALFSYPDFKVIYASELDRQRYEHYDLERRRQTARIDYEVDLRDFQDWVFRKIQGIRRVPIGWVERIEKAAKEFYDTTFKSPDEGVTGKIGKSWHDCCEEYWEATIDVDWDNYSRVIIHRKEQTA
jgi:hypothetical protein